MVHVTRRGAVHRRRHLRHPQPQHAPAGAGGARPHSNQHTRHAAPHQFQGHIVSNGVADDDRDGETFCKCRQFQGLVFRGKVPDGRDRRLHHKKIRPRFLCDGGEPLRLLRNRTHGGEHAGFFQFFHPAGDQFLLDRLQVKFLNQGGDFVLVGFDDLFEHLGRVFVTGLHSLQVDDAQSAEFAHFHAKFHVRHPVHRAGDDRYFERDMTAVLARYPETGVHLVGVDGHFTRHERDLVETIRHPCFSVTAYPHSHNSSCLFVKIVAAAPRLIKFRSTCAGPQPGCLKFNCVVQPAALRTARTLHIRVVRINQTALFAPENVVRTGGRPKPPAAQFRIYGEARKRRKQRNDISQNEQLGGHLILGCRGGDGVGGWHGVPVENHFAPRQDGRRNVRLARGQRLKTGGFRERQRVGVRRQRP